MLRRLSGTIAAGGRPVLIALSAIYAIAISMSYTQIAHRFQHQPGFQFRDSSALMEVFALIAALLPVTIMPLTNTRVSGVVITILYFVLYVPFVSLVHRVAFVDELGVLAWLFTTCAVFCLLMLVPRVPYIKLSWPRLRPMHFAMALLATFSMFMAILLSAFGFDIEFASIFDVYDQRNEFKEVVAGEGGRAIGYAVILGGYWLSPTLILSGVYYISAGSRRMGSILVLAGASLSAYVYGVAAYKSIALSFSFVLLFWWFVRRFGVKAMPVAIAALVFVASSWLTTRLLNTEFIAYHLLRRALIVPGINSSYYFELFNSGPNTSQTPASHIVSALYYHSTGSANAGFFASGFASGGLSGLLLAALALGMVLWLIDSASRKLDLRFVAPYLFMQTYALANTALPTVLVSYGLAASFLVLAMVPLGLFGARHQIGRSIDHRR